MSKILKTTSRVLKAKRPDSREASPSGQGKKIITKLDSEADALGSNSKLKEVRISPENR